MNTAEKPAGKITRLENMLVAWEDIMFVGNRRRDWIKGLKLDHRLHGNFVKDRGDLDNWRSFRKYLLDSVASGGTVGTFDHKRYGWSCDPYTTSIIAPDHYPVDLLLRSAFPQLLYNWTVGSRRVFRLSEDLQTLIAATSLEDVKLGDLRFPFDSFAIELPVPIVGESGNRYDMLLFASHSQNALSGGNNAGMCLLIPDRCAEYNPLSLALKRELTELSKRKKWDALKHKCHIAERHVLTYRNMHAPLLWQADNKEDLVTEHIAKLFQAFAKKGGFDDIGALGDRVAQQQALRILAGVCLYIRTLPAVSKHRTEWQDADIEPLAMPVQAVVDEAQVCMLSCEFTLSPEERNLLESKSVSEELAGCTQKNPHFRRGFWRRPPGEGQNPDAEKSVWVRPTVIDRHLLQKGQLPLGAETILLPVKT